VVPPVWPVVDVLVAVLAVPQEEVTLVSMSPGNQRTSPPEVGKKERSTLFWFLTLHADKRKISAVKYIMRKTIQLSFSLLFLGSRGFQHLI
jgi:hypothetical protein